MSTQKTFMRKDTKELNEDYFVSIVFFHVFKSNNLCFCKLPANLVFSLAAM